MSNVTVYTLFDKSFTTGPIEPSREHTIIAKQVTSEIPVSGTVLQSQRFFLKTVANRLINPNDFTLYELKKNDARFVEVDENTYRTYQDVINMRSVVPFRSLETRVNNA